MEFLRDSSWQFIGVIITVIVAFWIYLLQKNKKSFSYLILASNELLTASEEIRGRIKITFDKKAVQNVHLLIVKFTNNGNIPILPTDFYQPIKISFGEETKILSADVVEHSPETFEPSTLIEDSSISILPTLINSNDAFTIKFLLTEYKGIITVGGRIAGIKLITDVSVSPNLRRLRDLTAMGSVLSIMGFIVGGSLVEDLFRIFALLFGINYSVFLLVDARVNRHNKMLNKQK